MVGKKLVERSRTVKSRESDRPKNGLKGHETLPPGRLQEKTDTQVQILEAAKKGDTKRAEELIEKGADVNAKDVHGETALMKAIMCARIEIITILIEKGADVNARDKNGRTALRWATERGLTGTVKLLRAHGAKE